MSKTSPDNKRFGHKDYREKGMFYGLHDYLEKKRRDLPRRVREYKNTPGFPAEGTPAARKLRKQGKPVAAI